MSSRNMWKILLGGSCGVCAAAALAQPPPPGLPGPPNDTVFFVQNAAPLGAFGGRIDILRNEGGVPGPVVKGKPYSARSITESTQTLGDGNRIVQRNEAVMHRDSEGRSRREQTLRAVGPWQAEQPVTMINIHDPVAGTGYVLDPAEKTAREVRQFQMAFASAQGQIGTVATDVRPALEARPSFTPGVPVPPPGSAPLPGGSPTSVTVIERAEGGEAVRVFTRAEAGVALAPFPPGTVGMYEPGEDLGEQVLEGLLVKGTRMTDTIPAGTIGNDRPIEIVTERWYSEDIDAMVLQRYSDPRFGETTYRLVNVVRGEPSPDLFQVPQGYEIKSPEMPRAGVRVLPGTAGETVEFELRRTEPVPAR
jgi:hypothetical protein